MTDLSTKTVRAAIVGLDPVLSSSLKVALAANFCEVIRASKQADIIFCSPELPVLRQVQALYPNAPAIVVSRDAEVEAWLDALEAGATDYCAPPFEPIHMRWILGNHLRSRAVAAA